MTALREPNVATGVTGLRAAEVRERVERGATNATRRPASRTVADIVRANALTRFNFVLGTLLVVILVVGPAQDALFGIVLVANTAIGIVQELRAKATLDHLALSVAARARVVRDATVHDVDRADVVIDDVMQVAGGDEVVADAVVIDATSLEVDESLLTGESEPVDKVVGDEVLAGSFIASGSALLRATRVGDDAAAAIIDREARRFSLVRSELRTGINRILAVVVYLQIPVAVLLIATQLRVHTSAADAARSSVGGIVGMIPEGLVLLTSIAFAVGVVRLGRQHVLVNELAAIEGLARVDVVCLDKTGTLTDGSLVLAALQTLDASVDDATLCNALGALAHADPVPNQSLRSIAGACPAPDWNIELWVPFSSARKWSAVDAGPRGAWILGAPDVLVSPTTARDVLAEVERRAGAGRRVLLVARADALLGEETPPGLRPVALVELEERLRPDAAATVAWFGREAVSLRVLSGDHPATAASVAARVGIDVGDGPVDARDLPTDAEGIARAITRHPVVGRVTPERKQAIVEALQRGGHVVAMTGDGVNDVPALKAADLGVAMGAGTAAARAVGRVVLLDNSFARLPAVVAEGRRVIANVERVANLFLTKTVYATLLAVAVGVAGLPYPFYPRHLTLVSSLTIGIPAFFLALAPNATLAKPGFVPRVLRFAVPVGSIAAVATFSSYAIARTRADVDLAAARSTATLVLFAVAMRVLVLLVQRGSLWQDALVATMTAAFVVAIAVAPARGFFDLTLPNTAVLAGSAMIVAAAWVATGVATRVMRR